MSKIKLSLYLNKHFSMEMHGGMAVYIHIILALPLLGDELSAHAVLPPRGNSTGTQWMRGRKETNTGIENMERRKVLPVLELELRPLSRPLCRDF
jgi:hypothetical protein